MRVCFPQKRYRSSLIWRMNTEHTSPKDECVLYSSARSNETDVFLWKTHERGFYFITHDLLMSRNFTLEANPLIQVYFNLNLQRKHSMLRCVNKMNLADAVAKQPLCSACCSCCLW